MSKITSQPALASRKPRLNREEQKVARTQELIEAAWAMYCQKGYEAVTIDDVAEYAGYSRMPIYSLFGDKQNLYFEVWRSVVTELTKVMIKPLQAGAPLRRNLEKLAKVVTPPKVNANPERKAAPAPEGLFFVAQTIALNRPDIAVKLEKVAQQAVDDVAEMIRNSTLDNNERLRGSAETVAAHLVAQINGLATVQLQTHKQFFNARDLAEVFIAIAIKPA